MSVEHHSFAIKCREHWEHSKFSNPEILKQRILEAFDRNTNQQQVVVDLYKLVLPDWDQIQSLNGHPEVGMELALFICRKFQDFDRQHHPNCMPGGAWLNWGFSVNRDLDPWAISFENCVVVPIEKTAL
jgi:hypothetical protein